MVNSVEIRAGRTGGSGFTLIELILATAISAIVIGILSACLSFSMRAWESVQNRQPDQSALPVDLLKRQLAEIDVTAIKFQDGTHPLFIGRHDSIAFATAHSVKSISQGVPVAVRYSYDPRSKVVLYSEVPMDPYHPQIMLDFLNDKSSGNDKGKTRFYEINIPGFALSYAGKDATQFSEQWNKPKEIPIEVLLTWNSPDSGARSQMFMVNCPFPIAVLPTNPQAGPTGGISPND